MSDQQTETAEQPPVAWVFQPEGDLIEKADVLDSKRKDPETGELLVKQEITLPEEFSSYSEILAQAKKFIKDVDKQRLAANKPAQDAIAAINAQAAVLKTRLQVIVDQFTPPVTKFLEAQARAEEEARALREKEQREAEEAQRAEEAAAEPSEGRSVADAMAAAVPPPRPVAKEVAPERLRGALGSTTLLKKTWDYEVTAPSKIPAKYVEIKKGLVRKAISNMTEEEKNAGGNIPGIRVFAKTGISSKTS